MKGALLPFKGQSYQALRQRPNLSRLFISFHRTAAALLGKISCSDGIKAKWICRRVSSQGWGRREDVKDCTQGRFEGAQPHAIQPPHLFHRTRMNSR